MVARGAAGWGNRPLSQPHLASETRARAHSLSTMRSAIAAAKEVKTSAVGHGFAKALRLARGLPLRPVPTDAAVTVPRAARTRGKLLTRACR